ncbi:CcdB family protein [Brevundimonas sp.]
MRQFDVYPNPNEPMRPGAPFVVVLSSHYLDDLTETVVAPLFSGRTKTVNKLEVAVNVDGRSLLLVLTGLAALRTRDLGRPVGSLLAYEDDIRRALDRLFTGF